MPRPSIEKLDPTRTSVPGAAKFLDLAEGYIRKLADDGVLPHSRASNGARVFLISDLERYALNRAGRKLWRQQATK